MRSEEERKERHPPGMPERLRDGPIHSILKKLEGQAQERLLLTIDGPCGSGKSTLAALLADILQAPVVHTDDFVVPHARKTPERLSIPGGNEDHERLTAELIRPWKETGRAQSRPYRFREDRCGEPIVLSGGRYLILEGSYSNLPDLRAYADVRVYLTVPPEVQLERLRRRESEVSMKMFLQRWIPLENAYREAYHLPDDGCLVLDGESLQVLRE